MGISTDVIIQHRRWCVLLLPNPMVLSGITNAIVFSVAVLRECTQQRNVVYHVICVTRCDLIDFLHSL